MRYNDHIVKSILRNNQFGITAVNDIKDLRTLFFVNEEYPTIEKLIQGNEVEAIKQFSQNVSKGHEYLNILSFTDQNENTYLIAIYDSNTLEQDPQVIEIYSVGQAISSGT